jgi:hypothetical protein
MPDFNQAGPQRVFDVIPAGTIAPLQLKVRPGGAGEGGWLRRSKGGDSEALDCEFLVTDGPYAKRKFWTLLTVSGTTEGHAQAAEISRSKVHAILESARGIRPDDASESGKQARQIATYGDLNGLRFIARIGVEPARDNYPAKNILLDAVTPDRRDWHPVEQVSQSDAAPTATCHTVGVEQPAKIEKPAWAK